MKISASKGYMKKEELRQALQSLLEARVSSGDIASQEDLDNFWSTIDIASRALKSIPFDVFSRILTVREVREIVRTILIEVEDS